MPIIPEVGVIVLPPDPWSSPFVRHDGRVMTRSSHQIMGRLSSIFHIAWVEPAHQRDAMVQAIRDWGRRGPRRGGAEPEGLRALPAPPWLPELHRPRWLRDEVRWRRLARAERSLRQRGAKHIVLSVWRPMYAHALLQMPHAYSCYHVCDEYSFADHAPSNSPEEEQLLRSVDHVFVHSPGLMEMKGRLNPATTLTPNGVDYAAFARSWPEPDALAGIPRPRLGYTGAIKKHLDWDLMRLIAIQNPDWSIVLMGAQEPHPEIIEPMRDLKAMPNVRFLPPVSAAEVPGFVAHFDICMLPYRRMPYTDQIYPLKLHEYLAAGKPVLATPIRTLRDFADVITLSESANEWSAMLRQGASVDPVEVGARQAVAARFDWTNPTATIARELTQALVPARQDDLETLTASWQLHGLRGAGAR